MSVTDSSRYSNERYRNWLGCLNGLRVLRCRLRNFLEDKTQEFHRMLVDQFGTDGCISNCEIKKNPKPQELPDVCEVCTHWCYELWTNHSTNGAPIHWINCNPQRWTQDKWEVAKVYMPSGHRTHIKFDDFDIAALINLMSNCTHFHQFIRAKRVQQVLNSVTEVRNQVMHSPDYTMSQTERDQHLAKIRLLGKVLKAHAPEMISLSEEIDKGIQEQSPEEMRKMELSVMSDEIGFIMQSFSQGTSEGSQQAIEAADRMLAFVLHHRDLQEALSVQTAQLFILRANTEAIIAAIECEKENLKQVALRCQQGLQRAKEEIERVKEHLREVQLFAAGQLALVAVISLLISYAVYKWLLI